MGMQATTVDILIDKAKFDPQVALAVAEAIDNEQHGSRLVSVPILDARLAGLKSELVRWMIITVFGQSTMLTSVMYFLLERA